MEKLPIMYSTRQMNKIQKFINDNFGEAGDFICHEVYSEYVHTDVQISTNKDGVKSFVTFGMSARETAALLKDYERIELVMYASKDFDDKIKAAIVMAELQKLSKYPFRENSWYGPGHTINVSEKFREVFGFDYIIFYDLGLSFNMSKSHTVKFLLAVPIYNEEREWIVENDSFVFLEGLLEEHGENAFKVDFNREMYIPGFSVDSEELSLMKALGIDAETLRQLSEYLSRMEENGEEITYEVIEKWVEENR